MNQVHNYMQRLRSGSFAFLLLLFSVSALSGCSHKERWSGYIFPDKDNLLIHRIVGNDFESLETCRQHCRSALESLHAGHSGYYECGKNCKNSSDYYVRQCEEIIRDLIY